jgi:hypothetical protein
MLPFPPYCTLHQIIYNCIFQSVLLLGCGIVDRGIVVLFQSRVTEFSLPKTFSYYLTRLLLVLLLLLLFLTALQLLMQSFVLLNQFLLSISILDRGFTIWHF